MSNEGRDLQYLLDRAAIEDVELRYFQGLDRGDAAQVRACFAEDARAIYDDRPPVVGADALIGSITFFFDALHAGDDASVTDRIKTATHFKGNFSLLKLSGDDAETETYAIAFLTRPGDSGDRIAVRGLRYLDRLRRIDGEWRIVERQHTLDWSTEVSATFATTLGRRIRALPEAAG